MGVAGERGGGEDGSFFVGFFLELGGMLVEERSVILRCLDIKREMLLSIVIIGFVASMLFVVIGEGIENFILVRVFIVKSVCIFILRYFKLFFFLFCGNLWWFDIILSF